MANFQVGNLLSDLPPFASCDIIFCRNVLIYFDPETKIRVLKRFQNALAPNGYLLLGGSETILGLSDDFTTVLETRGVYQLKSRLNTGAAKIHSTDQTPTSETLRENFVIPTSLAAHQV